MRRLTKTLRAELSKPFGPILRDYEVLKGRRLISVGDISTLRLIERGIHPWFAVCDGRSLRKKIPEENLIRIKQAYDKMYMASNPPGHISDEALRVCKKGIREGGLLLIEGEEDLLALVVIMNLPDGWLCVYGQPGEGLVCVEGNEKNRRKAHNIFSRFDHISFDDK
ncbi:MAG: GTP-dependent dephospho-CoA kinase family protein [Candidatus Asgardarchaeia archaeon]